MRKQNIIITETIMSLVENHWKKIILLYMSIRKGGDIGLSITLVPKVFNNVLLSVVIKTLGTFIEI